MNVDKVKYEGQIHNMVTDSINNFILNGLAEEVDFRMWFSERKHYYKNRLVRAVIKARPNSNEQVYQFLQALMDVIKKVDYEKAKETENINVVNGSNSITDSSISR